MKYKGVVYSEDELKKADVTLNELYEHNLIGVQADPDPLTRDVLLVLALAEDAPQRGFYRISNDGRLAKKLGGIAQFLKREKCQYIKTQSIKVMPIVFVGIAMFINGYQTYLSKKSFDAAEVLNQKNIMSNKNQIMLNEMNIWNAKLIHEIDSLKALKK